jgi:hypothetical protein
VYISIAPCRTSRQGNADFGARDGIARFVDGRLVGVVDRGVGITCQYLNVGFVEVISVGKEAGACTGRARHAGEDADGGVIQVGEACGELCGGLVGRVTGGAEDEGRGGRVANCSLTRVLVGDG